MLEIRYIEKASSVIDSVMVVNPLKTCKGFGIMAVPILGTLALNLLDYKLRIFGMRVSKLLQHINLKTAPITDQLLATEKEPSLHLAKEIGYPLVYRSNPICVRRSRAWIVLRIKWTLSVYMDKLRLKGFYDSPVL